MNAARSETAQGPAHFDALQHEAPYLIEKLLKERIVDSEAEGQALFREVKRFIVLVRTDPSVLWDMYSLRIDEAWHQFVLFTREYIEFCAKYFGLYIQHSPSNAPVSEDDEIREPREVPTFQLFEKRYQELFGEPLPEVWLDETSVVPHRRVVNDLAGALTVREDGDLISLVDACGHVVLSINELARGALHFIATTGAFYVRELPGGLTDDEKVAVIAALVEHRVLRVAS